MTFLKVHNSSLLKNQLVESHMKIQLNKEILEYKHLLLKEKLLL